MVLPFPRLIGIRFRLSISLKSTPVVTERLWLPTSVLPAGYARSADATAVATWLMLKWYCFNRSGITSTFMYSSRPPLISTLATEEIFSSSGTIFLSTKL